MYTKGRGMGFSGFTVASKDSGGKAAIPPPPSLSSTSRSRGAIPPSNSISPASGSVGSTKQTNRQGYYTMSSISTNALSAAFGYGQKTKPKTEDEYFESDEEDKPAYQPAPGSPGEAKNGSDGSASEEDPLDAFMEGINAKAKYEMQVAKEGGGKKTKRDLKGIRDDIEMEDAEESYYKYVAENPILPSADDTSDTEIEYDAEGNPIIPTKSKHIDPLPRIDHSEVEYLPFEKIFYVEPEDIKDLEADQVEELRNKLGIKVSGPSPPKPVSSFAHFSLDGGLMKVIRKQEYTQPTPIQAQAVPAALLGRDVLGIAKTGSGKTAAFVWPMITHILDQPALDLKDGPIGIILAPTRELALQIHTEVRRFGRPYGIRVVCCYGGGSKWEQSKALEEGAEIVVATPGRMIDMVKIEATNLRRVTFLVLDEADRMFDMGFEPQVRSICDHVRPDRQTLMFSATFKKKIEKLARDVLVDPVKIVQGDIGEANVDVTQIVEMMPNVQAKWKWLLTHLVEFTSFGTLLIFVTKKVDAEQLSANLKVHETPNELIHGDMDQTERNRVITAFKKKEINILVATDVAARGLDIPHIRTVVNYDVARDIDTHTHRIGRTGRAGEKGTAYTLVTSQDKDFAGHLVRNLEGVGQEPPRSLVDLAMQSSWFRKSRYKSDQGRKPGVGGFGLGFIEGKKARVGDGKSTTEVLQTVRTANSTVSNSGAGTSRLNALKTAFESQYKQFQVSKEDSIIPSNYKSPAYSPFSESGRQEGKPRKKSRWAETPEEST